VEHLRNIVLIINTNSGEAGRHSRAVHARPVAADSSTPLWSSGPRACLNMGWKVQPGSCLSPPPSPLPVPMCLGEWKLSC